MDCYFLLNKVFHDCRFDTILFKKSTSWIADDFNAAWHKLMTCEITYVRTDPFMRPPITGQIHVATPSGAFHGM